MKRLYLFVLLLAGCATGGEGRWLKSGATEQDFYVDRGQCIAQMESVPFAGTLQKARLFAGCMQGKGWQWVE